MDDTDLEKVRDRLMVGVPVGALLCLFGGAYLVDGSHGVGVALLAVGGFAVAGIIIKILAEVM